MPLTAAPPGPAERRPAMGKPRAQPPASLPGPVSTPDTPAERRCCQTRSRRPRGLSPCHTRTGGGGPFRRTQEAQRRSRHRASRGRKRQRPQGRKCGAPTPMFPVGLAPSRPQPVPLTEKLSGKHTLRCWLLPQPLSFPVTAVSTHQTPKPRGNGGRQGPRAMAVPSLQLRGDRSSRRPFPSPRVPAAAWPRGLAPRGLESGQGVSAGGSTLQAPLGLSRSGTPGPQQV